MGWRNGGGAAVPPSHPSPKLPQSPVIPNGAKRNEESQQLPIPKLRDRDGSYREKGCVLRIFLVCSIIVQDGGIIWPVPPGLSIGAGICSAGLKPGATIPVVPTGLQSPHLHISPSSHHLITILRTPYGDTPETLRKRLT